MIYPKHEIHASSSNVPLLTFAERLSPAIMADVLARSLREGAVGCSGETFVFFDLSRLQNLLDRLKAAFPPTTLHAVAVKANPTVEILRQICLAGHGCEVASIGELELANTVGFPHEAVVFDSPVKTREELEYALRLGIGINANSLGELERIDALYSPSSSRSRIGVRINPETGKGSINTTSVATHNSKFGVPMKKNRDTLLRVFSAYKWLTGVHVHIGSQGMSPEQLLEGVGTVYDFFVEARQSTEVTVFNIGGGLPAKYRESEKPIRFAEYADSLRLRCPDLFTPSVSLVTEFGRSLHASCGWVASKIEYRVESSDGTPTLLVHVGADMFVRKAYRPDDWHHDISVCDSKGNLRTGTMRTFRVAGPLCFAGDYLDRSVSLPNDATEGDYVIVHDAGAYTFSMWSLYNSRQFPPIIGYEGPGTKFRHLRNRQSVEDIVKFWSCVT
jgi:diaminopimelate decarboxylase